MVRIPPSGTWERRRADLYGLAELRLGAEVALTEQQALERLVSRYLGGFAPASLNDIAGWASIPPMALVPILAPLPNEDTPAPVRFLPTWDATLLVRSRRTGILPEAYRKIVFNIRKPQSMGTFLVDGCVAGAWKEQRGKIVLEPFGRISRNTRRELDEEGERLLAIYA